MRKNTIIIQLLLISLFVSCSKSDSGSGGNTPVIVNSPPVSISLDPTTTYQTITGFGGANSMWGNETLNSSDTDKAFGTGDNQLGLSVFRVRLSSDKTEWPIIVETVKAANKNGVKVLASPWSPPAALKSNNSTVGGYLLPEKYEAFKIYINEFLSYMTANGAKIDVVSIQNEPDWTATYESCSYSSIQFNNFFKAPGQIVGAKVAAPESLNFNQTIINDILGDAVASSKIDIVAGHTYGGGTAKIPLAEQQNKEIWMTEYLLNLNSGNTGAAAWSTYSEGTKWDESMLMLTGIHNAMTSNWNAYIWWYLKRYYSFIGDGEQGTVNGELLKRGIAYSHFSKFVRPGSVRIATVLPTSSNLKLTAYVKNSQTVIVAINNGVSVNNVQFSGLKPVSAASYTTTALTSLVKKDLTISNGMVLLDIPPFSVVTVVVNN